MMRKLFSLWFILTCVLVDVGAANAQSPSLAGDWFGTLHTPTKDLQFVVRISGTIGSLVGTLDDPVDNVFAIPLDTVTAASIPSATPGAPAGITLQFAVNVLQLGFSGTGTSQSVSGTYTQHGYALPLSLGSLVPATNAVANWSGTLNAPGAQLLLILHVNQQGGGLSATMDSPTQGITNTPVDCIGVSGTTLVFEMSSLKVFFMGTLSGNTMTGQFIQNGSSVPMTFQH